MGMGVVPAPSILWIGESLVGVWNCIFFQALSFKLQSLKLGENLFLQKNFSAFLEISASERFFGLWKMTIQYATNPYLH